MDLSLVLVSYRHRVALAACLDSLPAACAGLQYEVIVVDNAPDDGLIEDFRVHRPEVRTIANKTNEGFARGVNRGLAVAYTGVTMTDGEGSKLSRSARA